MFQTPNTDKLISFDLFIRISLKASDSSMSYWFFFLFFFWSSAPKLTIRVFLFVQRTAGTCYSLQHFIDYLTHTVAVSPQLSIASLPHQAVFPAHYTKSTMFLLSFLINFFLHFSKCFPPKGAHPQGRSTYVTFDQAEERYMKTNEWTCWITTEPSLICSFDFSSVIALPRPHTNTELYITGI